jgi:ActR/RegA family two-component response regulator
MEMVADRQGTQKEHQAQQHSDIACNFCFNRISSLSVFFILSTVLGIEIGTDFNGTSIALIMGNRILSNTNNYQGASMKNIKTNFKRYWSNALNSFEKPEILIGGDAVSCETIDEIQNMGMNPIKSSGANIVSFSINLSPSCIILDYKNASDAIVSLAKILRLKPYAKIIVAAETLTLSDAMEIIDMGAFDCLIKPLDYKELEWRISEGISESFFTDIELKPHETSSFINV